MGSIASSSGAGASLSTCAGPRVVGMGPPRPGSIGGWLPYRLGCSVVPAAVPETTGVCCRLCAEACC